MVHSWGDAWRDTYDAWKLMAPDEERDMYARYDDEEEEYWIIEEREREEELARVARLDNRLCVAEYGPWAAPGEEIRF